MLQWKDRQSTKKMFNTIMMIKSMLQKRKYKISFKYLFHNYIQDKVTLLFQTR